MAASEFQKKALTFIAVFVVMAAILAALPLVETWLQTEFLPQFGLHFTLGSSWDLTSESADMTKATYVGLFANFFHVLKIILWMILIISAVRFLTYLIFLAALRNSGQSEISSLLRTVLSMVFYIVAFFIIFQTQYPGVNLGAIFTGSAILGIVVGLALQETLGNLFAGIALQADQPFQVGDVVTIPNRGMGVVETVSWRGVKIRTFQNKLLIISNSVLGKESIEVAPKGNLNASSVRFNTEYSDSPARTAQIVREAVRQAENVSHKLRPNVRIRDLGAYAIDWEVKYWLDDFTKLNDTDALVRRNIWYAFQRDKITFAYPTQTLHIQDKSEEVELEDKVNLIAERLNGVPIFAPLSEEETERLALAARSRIFANGESIVRAGNEGNSMFIIVRGHVRVQVVENGVSKIVNTLGENDFFGEMSLLTGEKRTATVVAEDETEVLRIEKSALKPIFENNPGVVETIGQIVAERRLGLAAATEHSDQTSAEKTRGVLTSIRRFFGLK
ncbi:MAG: mechanosensitive ion channel family protein [Acidobacteriota bacterium]